MSTMGRLLGSCLLLACATRTLAAQAPDGAALYREHCKECHGSAGRPPKQARDKYKDVKTLDAAFLASRSDDSLLTVLKRGAKDGKEMKPLEEKLKIGRAHV